MTRAIWILSSSWCALLLLAADRAHAWDPLQKAHRAAGRGQQQLAEGDAKAAVEALLQAQALAPEDPSIRLGLGEALYVQGDYATAMTQFQGAADGLGGGLARDALYNAGNAAFRRQDYQRALGLFQQALLAGPSDADLLRNLELTQKLIEQSRQQQQQNQQGDQDQQQQEQQQQQQNQPQDQQQQQSGEQQQEQQQQQQEQQQQEQQEQPQQQPAEPPPPQPSQADSAQARPDSSQAIQPPPGMTPEEAMRLLGALDHDEEQLRRSIQRRLRGAETENERDW
jgi:tetratricopeptide (TPR) repeat protein